MATDQLEMGFLEKLGEKFSNLGDGVVKVFTRVLGGTSSDRYVKKIGFIPSGDPDKPHTIIPGSLLEQVGLPKLQGQWLIVRLPNWLSAALALAAI